MRQFNKGFSIIELLVALAILGILVGFAIPQYGDHVKKAKVSEAVVLTQEIMTAMVSSYNKKRKFPTNVGNRNIRNKSVGLRDASSYETEIISSMWIGSQGVVGADDTSGHIAITLDPELKAGLNGASRAMLLSTIEADGSGGFEFICGNTAAKWSSTVDPAYLPTSCHN